MDDDQIHADEAASIAWLSGGAGPQERAPTLLPSAPGMELLNTLLEGGKERVTALASTTLHRIISEVGLTDAYELLELAEPEQVRELLDLEGWSGDRVDVETLLDWTQALSLLSDATGPRHLWGLDVELLAYLLRTQARLYLAQRDELPEEAEGAFYTTPDNWFVVDLLCENELRAEQLTLLIEKLYRDDAERARTLLHNVMWELPSELEESALRWRTGRLQDLGFEDPIEALRVYAYLDPASVRPDEATTDRTLRSDPEPSGETDETALAPLLSGGSFSSTLAGLEPAERARVTRALALLANRVLSADRVNPSDTEHARHSLRMLQGRLSLGLEHLCAGDTTTRGAAVLAQVALARIARLGHSLVLDVAQPALVAARDGLWGRRGGALDLLPPLLQRRIGMLLASRPLFANQDPPRPFERRTDLAQARAWVSEALDAAALVPLGARPAEVPVGASLADLFRTSVVNRVLRRPDAPLDEEALRTLLAQHRDPDSPVLLSQAIIDGARELMQERLQPSRRDILPAARLVERFFQELGQAFSHLSSDGLDLRFVDGLLLDRPET